MESKTVKEEKKIEQQVGGLIDANRVMGFSDAVFAFAATLLVLKVDLPVIAGDPTSNFSLAFSTLWPQYMANIISFFVIGYYWLNHHAIFSMIKRYNGVVVWLNIIFLIFLSFIPFPVDLYGDFPTSPTVVVFYSCSLAVAGFMLAILWWYASTDAHLVGRDVRRSDATYYLVRTLIAPVVFMLSVPIVYIHPILAQLSWILILLGVFLTGRFMHRQKISKMDEVVV